MDALLERLADVLFDQWLAEKKKLAVHSAIAAEAAASDNEGYES